MNTSQNYHKNAKNVEHNIKQIFVFKIFFEWCTVRYEHNLNIFLSTRMYSFSTVKKEKC